MLAAYSISGRSLTGRQADANTGHGFVILMASVGVLRTFGAPAPLTLGIERQLLQTLNVAFGHIAAPPKNPAANFNHSATPTA